MPTPLLRLKTKQRESDNVEVGWKTQSTSNIHNRIARCKYLEVEMTRKLLMLAVVLAFVVGMMPGDAEAQAVYTVHAMVWDPDPQVPVAYDCEA